MAECPLVARPMRVRFSLSPSTHMHIVYTIRSLGHIISYLKSKLILVFLLGAFDPTDRQGLSLDPPRQCPRIISAPLGPSRRNLLGLMDIRARDTAILASDEI